MSAKVFPLKDNQALAVAPLDSVWLSASAGTGKTQVLSARVLRLLLEEGVRPEQILCLTFTKAGAAEMATRVNDVLASWVRLGDEALGKDLLAIGARNDPATIARARSLFAAVLDCPGGGLRIDTIHAFAQWLLGAFPEEAGLVPGTKAMEDRDRAALAQRVLSEQLEQWERDDPAAVAALEMLSLAKGPDGARSWLARCASARDLWLGAGGWQPPMAPRVKRLIGLGADVTADTLAQACEESAFDSAALRLLLAAYEEWGTKSAAKYSGPITAWLASDGADRAAGVADLITVVFNDEGAPKYAANLLKLNPAIAAIADQARTALEAVRDQKLLLDLADFIAPALELGRKYALAWDDAKAREGLVDFDDLIERAARLLTTEAMGDWIRYKLDRNIDHVLIDEAQDTNAAQWSIIDALTDDFFSGEGQAGERNRTIFVVGDYKQAIFGFQGTSPENFASARNRYAQLLRVRRENAAALRDARDFKDLQSLPLGRSFRTARPVLEFVDAAIERIGHANIGLDQHPGEHIGDDRPGLVTLWPPVPGGEDDPGEDDRGADDIGADADSDSDLRTTEPERRMADKIASQIKHWLDNGFPLAKGKARNATEGDIMVLVRKRSALAGLIVARLYAAGVKVAGVDRLRLGAPLAVKDLLAALRFAVQPRDDLSLACLLASPLIGWTQEQLLEHGHRKQSGTLWRHLQDSNHPEATDAVERLKALLSLADFEPPQALLHWLLVGPWQGRRKLLARLGREASDPIDELLNAAHQFAANHTPSLQGFLHWFDSDDGELKREAEGPGGLVRVMTVHGSKGLQAPIVILADACGNPEKSKARDLVLTEDGSGQKVPIPDLTNDQRIGRIAADYEAAKATEMQEHWRLLYVAMTRAEEALFIGGALGKKKHEAPEASWYAMLSPLFAGEAFADPIWGERYELGTHAPEVSAREQSLLPILPGVPEWARRPIGPEPRPPRPLAPSGMGEDNSADPPLPAAQAAIAARRGVLIHALLERLPDVPQDLRVASGRAWLSRQAADLTDEERAEMLARALRVLEEPQWRDLFGPGALAEVPIAAIVGSDVIAGTIDRLLVEDKRILVADFKTARRPPADLAGVPDATLKQMAAYVAALEVIYPGRSIEAAILYTQTPQLLAIPAKIIAAHKPALTQAQ